MDEKNKVSFEEIFDQNKRRIHYQIHKLNITDPHEEFFQEGLVAMWNAYERYQPDRGPMSTYFNYIIRNRLIDLMRKQNRDRERDLNAIEERKGLISNGNHHYKNGISRPIPDRNDLPVHDPHIWQCLQANLTENQWKWVYYHIAYGMLLKDIAIQENVSEEAVKSWGKQVRKKFKNPDFRNRILREDD